MTTAAEHGAAPAPTAPPDGLSLRGARLRLAALGLAIASLFALVTLSGGLSSERVRDWIEPLGVAAPLAFVPVSAALTVALFPGPLLAGASGLLFGTALGFPVSLASAVLGASAAFTVSRRLGARSIERLAGPRLERLQGWIEARGFLAVLYARIAPGVPYNLVNYAAGLSRIPLRTFAAATALGAAPRAFAYTALGGSLDDLTSPEALVAFAVLAVMAIAGAVLAYHDGRRSSRSKPA
ncbi:MAG: TVP38/TMEM64 family protein [Solirubrobacteraceae bacterium]